MLKIFTEENLRIGMKFRFNRENGHVYKLFAIDRPAEILHFKRAKDGLVLKYSFDFFLNSKIKS